VRAGAKLVWNVNLIRQVLLEEQYSIADLVKCGKLCDPLTMCAIPERFCDGLSWLAHKKLLYHMSSTLLLPYLGPACLELVRHIANKFGTCPPQAADLSARCREHVRNLLVLRE